MKIEKIILIVITSILILTTFEVKAEELQGVYSSATYNYRLVEFSNVISESITKDMGDLSNNIPDNAYLDRYIMRVYSNTTSFNTGNTYSFNFYSTLNLDLVDLPNYTSADYLRTCYTATVYANTTSTSQESTTDLVKSKDIIISQDPNSSVRVYVKLIASFHQDVKFVSVLFKHKDSCNVYYAGSTTPVIPLKAIGLRTLDITYQQGTDSILNDQNQILQDGFDKIENAITGDHEYNEEPTEQIQGKEEINEMKELEENILGNLDLSATEELDITINPKASKFIWDIIEQLRGINDKIIMLITSILGLGIIKMILNR